MLSRLLETDFAYGFYDMYFYYHEWKRHLNKPSGYYYNGDECMYTKQATHDFFNGLAFASGCRDNGYDIWFEKYC